LFSDRGCLKLFMEIYLFTVPLVTFFIANLSAYLISGYFSYLWSSVYRKISVEDQVEWDSRVVSTIHAFVACVGGCYGIFFDPTFNHDRFIFSYSFISDLIVTNTAAYWIFDFLLILRYFKKLGEPGIVLHHIIGIIPFLFGRYHSEMLFYGCMMILTEFSTPFVNNRWFIAIILKNNPKSPVGQFEVPNGLAIWLSFVICRVIMLPILLHRLWFYQEDILKCHLTSTIPIVIGCVLVTVLSYYWFYKITKGIMKKLNERAKERQE